MLEAERKQQQEEEEQQQEKQNNTAVLALPPGEKSREGVADDADKIKGTLLKWSTR